MRLTTIALAGLALSLTSPLARAADLPPAPILDETDEPVGSGWYLRGDIGAIDRLASRGGRDFGSADLPPLVKARFNEGVAAGGGIGYQFAPWLRTDVTIDHRFNASFKGARFTSGATYALDRSDYEATTFLVNAYVDLGFWSGITPYIGAGIGGSRNRFASAERKRFASGVADTLGLPSRTDNALAWALMGGVAFDLGTNLKLDLGYRYTHLGNARTGTAGTEALVRAKDVSAHEFRIGARYMLD